MAGPAPGSRPGQPFGVSPGETASAAPEQAPRLATANPSNPPAQPDPKKHFANLPRGRLAESALFLGARGGRLAGYARVFRWSGLDGDARFDRAEASRAGGFRSPGAFAPVNRRPVETVTTAADEDYPVQQYARRLCGCA